MKKLVLVAALALSLGGCTTQFGTFTKAISLASKSVDNPIKAEDLYKIESGIQIVFVGLNTYKKSCVAGLVDVNCRANIAAIQKYTRQLPPYLTQLRAFVRNDDQVNAVSVYKNLTTLIANAKSTASAFGVNLGE